MGLRLDPAELARSAFSIGHADVRLLNLQAELAALKAEMGPRFDALREYITAGQPGTLKEVAVKLDLSEANVKVIIHRSRRRYLDLLKEEVARTVERKDEIDEELKELFAALS